MKFSKFSHSLRKKGIWVVATLFSALVGGCADDETPFVQPDPAESGYITLSLNCVEGTRAEGDYTEEGKTALHENLISNVTICLWAKGGDKPDDTAVPDYVQTFSSLSNEGVATLRIPLTLALYNKLFETTGAECHAFAAVNVGVPEGKFTIADYRNMAISSTFSQNRVQENFAMDGDGVVKYDVATKAATGKIDLRRSASKISLALNVDEIVEQSVVVDGNLVTSKWQPNTAQMRVWLNGGLAESTLDPDLEAKPAEGYFFDTANDKVYLFDNDNTDNGNNAGNTNYPFLQQIPFYTYPHRWSAEPGDYAATYMTLTIPWQQVRKVDTPEGEPEKYEPVPNSTWRTCYYQVPVIAADSDPLQLVRNIAYHVYLHVGLLGSFIPDKPLELEDLEYSAAEWGTVNMDVNIPDVRYLVVDQNDYTVNNETSISIPFYTSHETIVTDATMTFYRYNYTDAGLKKTVTVSMAQNEESAKDNRAGAPVFTAAFDNENKVLNVSHDIKIYEAYDSNNQLVSFTDNDGPNVETKDRRPNKEATWQTNVIDKISYFKKKIPEEDEYTQIEFKITLQHKDLQGTPNFKEEITITQYPGMYITAVENYHGAANATSFNFTGKQGNTIISGNADPGSDTDNRPSKGRSRGWVTSIGLKSSWNNFNPNMYLVTVTTLPSDTKYKIGDPRSKQINLYLRSGQPEYNPANTWAEKNPRTYTRNLITTGVNAPISSAENLTAWTGDNKPTYNWKFWNQTKVTSTGSVKVEGYRSARAIYPSPDSRLLQYYYPTLEDEEHKMMIAPKFRICSSYAGTTWILNRELARLRAASFQELGYAAGRWRLPTFGEVKFIMELAASYKIPRLFGTAAATWWYWCANGLVCVPSKKSGNTNVYLPDDQEYILPLIWGARDCHRARFVYDEWYWGDADLKANGELGSSSTVFTFTWGDKPF